MSDGWVRRTWEGAAARDAYFVVCNEDAYRSEVLDADAKSAFFRSGAAHVDWVFGVVERIVGARFHPSRALDFGCGVGRLLLPIAARAQAAVGCDVSGAMLAEAERNLRARGVTNVSLVQSSNDLRELAGRYDFVHSFITFQHIPPAVGERIVTRLLSALEPGGVAALQFTYRRRAPFWRRRVHAVRRAVPQLNALASLVSGGRAGGPFFPMYEYRLERLYELFRAAGCTSIGCELTQHGTHHGALLTARRALAPCRPDVA